MNITHRSQMPLDQGYYRTISPIYKKYLEKCKLRIHTLPNGKFWWVKNVLWITQIAKFERIDEEPDIEALKKDGFKGWFVIWIPYTRIEMPKWWRKMWWPFNSHFMMTGYSVIDREDYYKKWNERAQRARKKFLANKDLRIELVDKETFQKYYKHVRISQPYKSAFMKYHNSLSNFDENKDIKNMVCFHKDKVIAWLSVLDYNTTSSAHLVSFLTNEWKDLQAWTGLIDYWFKMSQESWLKYINFDHLKDKNMSRDQEWYTKFKENFMDYKIEFKESYFKYV